MIFFISNTFLNFSAKNSVFLASFKMTFKNGTYREIPKNVYSNQLNHFIILIHSCMRLQRHKNFLLILFIVRINSQNLEQKQFRLIREKKNTFFAFMLEWDGEWSGPQVIVEVSERATNVNTTHVEGNADIWYIIHYYMM